MYRDDLQEVSKDEFVKRMEDNLAFISSGGTDYRRETARISLEIVVELNDFSIFDNRQKVKIFVKSKLAGLDEERYDDVTESLYHQYRDLYLDKNLSEAVQEELIKRKKKRRVIFSHVSGKID
ncbi:MAG: hypothetical protein FWE07_01005 [Turicibacter sp.]|nr:hypothetical protein [Turicibacter sp.]